MRAADDDFALLEPSGYRTMPWRNGGGTTREILAQPDADDFDWRLSIADVARDGDFSPFAGYARTILLLQGAGMRLTVDGRTTALDTPFRPFDFDGGARTHGALVDGPVRDFNIMSRRARAWHEYAIIREFPAAIRPDERAALSVLFGLAGRVSLVVADRTPILPAKHTLVLRAPLPVQLAATPGSAALLVRFYLR